MAGPSCAEVKLDELLRRINADSGRRGDCSLRGRPYRPEILTGRTFQWQGYKQYIGCVWKKSKKTKKGEKTYYDCWFEYGESKVLSKDDVVDMIKKKQWLPTIPYGKKIVSFSDNDDDVDELATIHEEPKFSDTTLQTYSRKRKREVVNRRKAVSANEAKRRCVSHSAGIAHRSHLAMQRNKHKWQLLFATLFNKYWKQYV